jgi:hypothetical protein
MTVPLTILQQKTIADQQGNWAQTVSFDQFDPSAGVLADAFFTTAGKIDLSASIENLAPVAATVNLGVAATIVASAPEIGVVASLTPVAAASVNLGAFQGTFDGRLDFGGPSGTIMPDITASQIQTDVVQAGPVGSLPLVGTGTFDVTVSSYATSTVNGNGNLAVLLHGSESAVLSLQYDATAPSVGGSSSDSDFLMGVVGSIFDIFYLPGVLGLTATIPQVVTLASQTSGWIGTASFDQFNPALGTLVDIVLNVGNTVAGTFSAENLESVPASVNMSEAASMTVGTPGFGTAATAIAAGGDSLSLGAYDGTSDFAGPSGQSATIAGPAGSGTSQATLVDGIDLAAFTGTGTIALPVSTSGTSVVTGPSNLLSEITQHTGGTVSVSYVYASPFVTSAAGASGPMGAAHVSAIGTVGAGAFNPPGMTFIGASLGASYVNAKPNETFLIGSGATATIGDFSLMAGDRLNLTGLLTGAPLAHDLANLGAFIRIVGQGPDANGGADTMLSFNGPGGTASLTLVSGKPIAVADLLNDNALVLPPH